MDPSLQILLTKGLQEVEYLDVGIKASGKLQLLDRMLTEMKNRGLRVLILFQVNFFILLYLFISFILLFF
jgi:hypothetical protein